MNDSLPKLLLQRSEAGPGAVLWGREAQPHFGRAFDRLLADGLLRERAPATSWPPCSTCEGRCDGRDIVTIGDLRVAECPEDHRGNTTLLASPITSAAQALARPGARFVCELSLDPVNAATSGRLDALLARLQGPLNRVRLWDFRRAVPRGPAGSYGTPTPQNFAWSPGPSWTDGTTWVDAAQAASPEVHLAVARGATAIPTWGWAANAVPLLAGDYVGLLGRAHMLVEDSPNAGALGRAVLSVLPSLRDDVPAGTAIVVQRASAPFRLVDNDQPANRTRPGPFASYALRFIEDLT